MLFYTERGQTSWADLTPYPLSHEERGRWANTVALEKRLALALRLAPLSCGSGAGGEVHLPQFP
jgi:hypothetical protein